MDKFCDRLRQAMGLRRMRQVDLVNKTGINKPRINQYLSGLYEPKFESLTKIAKALDVQEEWLLGYDVSMEKPNFENMDGTQLVEKVKIFDLISHEYDEGKSFLFSELCDLDLTEDDIENIIDYAKYLVTKRSDI